MSQTQLQNGDQPAPDSQDAPIDDEIEDKTGEGAGEGEGEGEDGAGEGEVDPQERDFQERLARARGWKPPEEWKGQRPRNFIEDPAEFNRSHENNNHRLLEENRQLRSDIDEIKTMARQSHDMLRSSKDAEIQRLKDDARRRMTEAVENADTQAFTEAQKDYDALLTAKGDEEKSTQPAAPAQPQAPQNPDNDPYFRAWHEENPWYGTDRARTNYANHTALVELKERGIGPQHGRLFYDEVSKIVERDLGPVQRPRRDGGRQNVAGDPPPRQGQKSFDSIPQEDRATFQKVLVKKLGVYKDDEKGRAEWAKAYWNEKQNQRLR